jgi:hypothetical protein
MQAQRSWDSLVTVTPFYAGPYDSVAYGNFAAWLARTFAGKIQAIEVCNEPNGDYDSKEGPNWQAKYLLLA